MSTTNASTLPRGFRFHHEEGPKTPEPISTGEIQPPSPPRQRFKVRRRNAASLQAPTEQFLASVAAADVAIPTIEIPIFQDDSEMVDRQEIQDIHLLAPQSYPYRFGSEPKTPMLQQSLEDAVLRRPDWAMGSPSPEPEEHLRPASSQSYASDNSDDSFNGSSHAYRPSEDGSCTSPESEADIFEFPIAPKGKGKAISHTDTSENVPLNAQLRSKKRRDAIWTPAQCDHLWSIYHIYLQDATVTPFRFGGGCVPPEGVCYRVAREAKKSWKGPKAESKALTRLDSESPRDSQKSGSATPTGDASKVYAAWPHSGSSTRAKLRELCKSDATGVARLHRHLQIPTPTRFSRLNPPRTPTSQMVVDPFGTKDIAMSLATSTAETMQADGPLARLAAPKTPTNPSTPCILGLNPAPKTPTLSTVDPEPFTPSWKLEAPAIPTFDSELSRTNPAPKTPTMPTIVAEPSRPAGLPKSRSLGNGIDQGRLGSPFVPFNHTYGPGSSNSLHPYERPTSSRTQSEKQPVLLSPVRFESRSLNNTSKRRAQYPLDDYLSPTGVTIRPSILDEQLFGTPFSQRRVRSRGFSLNDAGSRHRSGIFQHPPVVEPPKMKLPATQLLPSASGPPRLGSPFLESKTFPRRVPSDGSTIRRSAFATMHQSRRSIESFDFGRGPSRPTRVQQLDKALQQIHEREATANRNQPSE